jgi:hypothetical protein
MTERDSEVDRLLAENDAVVGERIDPDIEADLDETAMETGDPDDPDLEAARAQVSGHDPDALTTEELRPDGRRGCPTGCRPPPSRCRGRRRCAGRRRGRDRGRAWPSGRRPG